MFNLLCFPVDNGARDKANETPQPMGRVKCGCPALFPILIAVQQGRGARRTRRHTLSRCHDDPADVKSSPICCRAICLNPNSSLSYRHWIPVVLMFGRVLCFRGRLIFRPSIISFFSLHPGGINLKSRRITVARLLLSALQDKSKTRTNCFLSV